MSASAYAHAVRSFANFAAQERGVRMSHEELDQVYSSAYGAFSASEARCGKPKLDGLECVDWVKKYRNDHRSTLQAAKAEWDKRIRK